MNQDSYNFILALVKSLSGVRKPLRPCAECRLKRSSKYQ